jgi:isopenicillin N synthase-like dioxygenase
MMAGKAAPEAGPGRVPVIDVSELVRGSGDGGRRAAREIGEACRESGFFYVVGHGVQGELLTRLDRLARQFFARPVDDKMLLRMDLGGQAWRGYFPLGGELTSGKPDAKEGLYFGAELGGDDARVRAGVPLHGRNLFPADLPGFRETVLGYLDALTGLGHALMRGIALSLGLEAGYFRDRYMTDPLILFRIFRYPPVPAREGEPQWGVGEHTDYGMLTILMQDDVGRPTVGSTLHPCPAPSFATSATCWIA